MEPPKIPSFAQANSPLEFNLNISTTPRGHKFILFAEKPLKGILPEACFLIMDHLCKSLKYSRGDWKKEKQTYNIHWNELNGEKRTSKNVNYNIIADYLRKNNTFNQIDFNLPKIECHWLDNSMNMKLNFHGNDHSGTLGIASGTPQQQYGEKYPIKPVLKREGHLYTSFQPQLLKRIISQRTKLIEDSDKSIEDDWVFDLRSLLSDSISLIDITLTQLYIKAEYDPLPGWKFDLNKLGHRHGRRLNDKLKWVYQITGNNLNIEPEIGSLNILKELRNHLMHFDPPSLVITIEEATEWLNHIISIGLILVKMRKAIGAEISISLINFILQKEAVFNPPPGIPSQIERKPIGKSKDEDYFSCVWPIKK